jgi:hypothetical protein
MLLLPELLRKSETPLKYDELQSHLNIPHEDVSARVYDWLGKLEPQAYVLV